MTHTACSIGNIDIEAAQWSDLPELRRLLDLADLPSSDITEGAPKQFLVCRQESVLIGAVGLERYGSAALLRSLVVTRKWQGHGLGKRLVAAIEVVAGEFGVGAIYLLTTTARDFFEPIGYRCLDRQQAPITIRTTTQYSRLCPSTAVLMVKP